MRGTDLEERALEEALDVVRADWWHSTARPRIAAVSAINDEMAEIDAAVILRQSCRLEKLIASYRKLAALKVYERDRELIGELFEVLTDQVEVLQRLALMITPRKERG
jgi:hypothetical protein